MRDLRHHLLDVSFIVHRVFRDRSSIQWASWTVLQTPKRSSAVMFTAPTTSLREPGIHASSINDQKTDLIGGQPRYLEATIDFIQ